jgi:hypothetical protein
VRKRDIQTKKRGLIQKVVEGFGGFAEFLYLYSRTGKEKVTNFDDFLNFVPKRRKNSQFLLYLCSARQLSASEKNV